MERRADEIEETTQRLPNQKLADRLAYGVKCTARMLMTRRRFRPTAAYVRAVVSTGKRVAPLGEKTTRTPNLVQMDVHRVGSIRIGTNRFGSDWLQLQ